MIPVFNGWGKHGKNGWVDMDENLTLGDPLANHYMDTYLIWMRLNRPYDIAWD